MSLYAALPLGEREIRPCFGRTGGRAGRELSAGALTTFLPHACACGSARQNGGAVAVVWSMGYAGGRDW